MTPRDSVIPALKAELIQAFLDGRALEYQLACALLKLELGRKPKVARLESHREYARRRYWRLKAAARGTVRRERRAALRSEITTFLSGPVS